MMVLFSTAAIFTTFQSYFNVKSLYRESIEPTKETNAIKSQLESLSFEVSKYLQLSVKKEDFNAILQQLPADATVETDKGDFNNLQRSKISGILKELDQFFIQVNEKYKNESFKEELASLLKNWQIFQKKMSPKIEQAIYSQEEIIGINRDIAGLKLGVTNIEKYLNQLAIKEVDYVRYKSIIFIIVFIAAMIFAFLFSYRLNSGVLAEIEDLQNDFKKTHTHITAMINSIDQGFLMFNREAKIFETFTKSCIDLFGISPSGRLINEVLQIKPEGKENFLRWINFIFDQTIPFDSLKELGPRKMEFGKIGDRGYRYISLEYAIYKIEEEVQAVILIATDKTKQKIAEHTLALRDEKIEIIDKIVKNQRDYINGLGEIEGLMQELSDLSAIPEDELISHVPRALHTIKGLAATLGIKTLQQVAHEIEEVVNLQFEKNIKKAVRDTKKFYEQKLLPAFNHFKETYKDFLGPELIDGRRRLTIFKDELESELGKLGPELQDTFQDKFIRVDLTDVLKEVTFGIERRASYQSKKLAPPTFENMTRKIDPDKYKSLFSTFVHLFNNCVDHGIEFPQEREAAGKDPMGKIQTSCTQAGEHFLIVIQDDGGGVNNEILREKMHEKFPDSQDKSDHELLQYLFRPNTSTKASADAYSGRGVGLDATKKAIEDWGGSIEMFSQPGQGVRFEILIQAK